MTILSRYILTMFLRHTVMILFGMNAIFMVFDVLSNAGDITQNADNTLKTLWSYIGLRLPTIFVLVMPMAALLGAMMTMHKMVRGGEMMAMGSAGMTIYKVASVLAIGAVFLAVVQLSVSEYAASDSSVRLRLWVDNDYAGTPPAAPEAKTSWIETSDYIVHYKTASPDGHILHKPFVVRKAQDGLIESYIRASKASYDGDGWLLEDVYSKGNNAARAAEKEGNSSAKILLGMHPEDISAPAETLEEIRLTELWNIIFTRKSLSPSSSLHSLWFQRKLAQPLSVILMVIMAAPIGLFMARQYNAMLVSFGFIMAGFVFFVTEKLLFSLGESAALPSFLAIWSPLLIFGTMSLWFILYKQE